MAEQILRSGTTAVAKVTEQVPGQVSKVLYNSGGLQQQVVFDPSAEIVNDSTASLVYNTATDSFVVQKIHVNGGTF